MALLWADGFDHYGTMAETVKGAYASFRSASMVKTNPRTGLYSIQFAADGNIKKNLPAALKQIITRCSFFISTAPAGSRGGGLFNLYDNTTNQISIRMSASGEILCYRGFTTVAGTLLASSPPNTMTIGSWISLEIKVVIDNVNGSIEIRKNGSDIPVLLIIGIDTQQSANDKCNILSIGEDVFNSGGLLGFIDDFIIKDINGTRNNDFYSGDVRCRTDFPASNGPDQNWTVTGAASAYQAISNVPPDAAKYISATNIGDISNFGHTQLPLTSAFAYGIMVHSSLQKTDSGACDIELQINSDGVIAANNVTPTTNATWYSAAFEIDPNTGSEFTRDAYNAMLLQIERTA